MSPPRRRPPVRQRDTADCRCCPLGAHCWPDADPDDGPVPVLREAAIRGGDYLWRPGDNFRGPLIVHSGCVKIFQTTPTGEEQILRFALTGELIGLEALAGGRHLYYAQAQGEVLCCRIGWTPATANGAERGLERRLLRRASQLLAAAPRAPAPRDPPTAVLEFLREVAARLGHDDPGCEPPRRQLRLPMSRLDIGRYLGIAEETVCRAIRRLQERGLLEARGRQISLFEAAWR